jgi:hypothetical protein
MTFSHPAEIETYVEDDSQRYLFILMSDIHTGKHCVQRIQANPKSYAAIIYELWHAAEEEHYDAIIVEKPKNNPDWAGVIDRINKAGIPLLKKRQK